MTRSPQGRTTASLDERLPWGFTPAQAIEALRAVAEQRTSVQRMKRYQYEHAGVCRSPGCGARLRHVEYGWQSDQFCHRHYLMVRALRAARRAPYRYGADIPAAVYRLRSSSGRLLYVGVTDNGARRLAGHKSSQPWWGEVAVARTLWRCYASRIAAEIAEAAAIRDESPAHNAAPGNTPLLYAYERASLRRQLPAVMGSAQPICSHEGALGHPQPRPQYGNKHINRGDTSQ